MSIKYIELFAGIGGFRYGLEKASSRFECVFANEWDKYASLVYQNHYGAVDTRDIRSVSTNEIPDHDLLVGGFPCQAFSIAGKRKGFEDIRGTMFFEIARIVRDKRPRYILLENVKGLLSHDSGKTFQTILKILSDLGYECQWMVLNSKNFGVPQNRERVFIIGHLRGERRPEIFPIIGSSGETKTLVYAQKSDREIARIYDIQGLAPTLHHLKTGGWQEPKIAVPEDLMIRDGRDNRSCLRIGNGAKTGLYAMQWRRTEKGKIARKESQEKGRDYTPFGKEFREIVPNANKVIGTITAQAIAKDSLVGNETKIRRLTPTECARLQGFPDNWCEGLSDTQQYKCYGNAVTTNVIEYIASNLVNYL